MSGVLCDACQGYFQTAAHRCSVKLQEELNEQIVDKHRWLDILNETCKERDLARKEVEKLNLELMERDTRPDFERGEYAGQDAMMRHLEKMDENNNSAMATAVKKSPYVQGLYRLLAQHADSLDCASYSFGQEFDPEAAKAFHSEFCIVQKRCELWSKDLVKDG